MEHLTEIKSEILPPLPQLLQPALLESAEVFFQCPGEDYPISKAIHLSRLAAFYPKCRECPHKEHTGNLSLEIIERLKQTQRSRSSTQNPFTTEGVRGIYLNQINRTQAAHLTGAFSTILWESLPLKGVAPQKTTSFSKPKAVVMPVSQEQSRGPSVVIGFDERPSSPDIITGVASALRRNGCRVIDLGLTVPSILSFATNHLQAQGAIMVTGAQFGPSYTGLDFLLENSQPVSAGRHLEKIEQISLRGFGRASRQPGSQRTFHPMEAYRAQFQKHFHALRPLKIKIACSLRLVRETLNVLFDKLPCELNWVDIPHQKRDLLNPQDNDVQKMQKQMQADSADLGLIIDDDSRRCAFFAETGTLLSNLKVSRFLMQALSREQSSRNFLLDQSGQKELNEVPAGWNIHTHTGTLADSYFQMRQQQAVYAGGQSGYHWFRDAVPTCDAILTLAHVLAALSFSDAPFSEVISQ
ncbi:phosphohexomutase domain-containing protein [Gimesia algae]|uniref:Phosphomannomutase/phosphoglucomutase n=1 Tax=Gimesia algae TaxID=2527971 RepID=A0A517VIL4_9PLAN|nr:hypothetical protein [Gimesia algae]QDT92844.1 Phosphomannomutase/phosphoglucomutase [Gimesia algae]